MRMCFLFLMWLVFSAPVFAVEPDEMLRDPALEARARDVSRHVRCLVCQGEAIDDSQADLAKDLRLLVRQRLIAGDTNEEVLQYLQSRYGDFILLKPPVIGRNILLWLTPVFVLSAGCIAVVFFIRRQRT